MNESSTTEWDWWREEDLPPDAPDAVEDVAAQIGRLLETPEDDDGGGDLDLQELAAEAGPRVLGPAVAHLHACLDARSGEGTCPEEEAEIRRTRRRLAELTTRLWKASVETELSAYRRLLRDISHDIRSPLNSILFLADGLYSEQSGSLNKRQRRQMGVVYSAAASLLNLVNDLLDFARTAEGDVGEVAEVPFSAAGVVADVRRLVRPIAEHRGCALRMEVEARGPRVGDPQLLSRVLINLLSNAVEAAGENGEVVLRMGDEGGTLRVEVMDDGCGAPVERLRELLRPPRDEPLTRMLHGQIHGLGLVICGRMVRATGGDIDVDEGESGGRTRFVVELPFPPAS